MQKVLLVAVAILFALGVLTSYQKHILDYRVSAITETEFGQASAIEHREYLLRSCQSGVWKSAFSAQLYKCPLNRYTPPADWASYGCLGQISAVSTCSNVSYRNADVTLACTPIN